MKSITALSAALAGLFLATASFAMELTSKDAQNGGTFADAQVFNGMGYKGGNVSPEVSWTKGPEGTLSYVLTMYDPDAPTGSGWWHWVVFNIPASKTELPKGFGSKSYKATKPIVQSRTDFGKGGYGGPAPPPGPAHHYIITVYALKVKSLPLKATDSAAMVGFYANANKLDSAAITVMFGHP
ncbi:MAG TPA: YbhB/YbcL family Raf kinase inhibitor-like protein [bacterium]|nr:YbhB/YbcL family Raf kinase inhibitor-like protein [bacterium]